MADSTPTPPAPLLKGPIINVGNSSGDQVQLPVVPSGTTDFAIETSVDLQHWQTVRNYHINRADIVTVPDTVSDAGAQSSRFYRLRIPGDLVDDELARWKAHLISSYRFHYEPRIGFCNCITEATVTVEGGVVVSVTDAVRASGDPEPSPNPNDFPTIEALFEQIKTAEANTGFAWVGVQYDPELSFPGEMAYWTLPDLPHGFVVSKFERLP